MPELSDKQKRIAELKSQGLKNPQVGAEVYPNANPTSQRQLVSRELKKPHVAQYYEQGKIQALKSNNINWDRIIKPINDALEAVKVVTSHTEPDYEIPDHAIRLTASKHARELLKELSQNTQPQAHDSITSKQLAEAVESGDILTIQQLVLEKSWLDWTVQLGVYRVVNWGYSGFTDERLS